MSDIVSTQISPQVEAAKQRFGIVGYTPALIEAIQRAIKVAPIDLSVLITGESGTGKEFFPQIIHHFSARKHSKYIAVNCGAIPEGTIESELFGHEKGSFTGAVASRKGYFEEADGGTIFLDEVAELPLTTQARLLRVLESGEFLKVGSSVVQKTNVRIVAATNVDMMQAVADGRFREDLYYRLSTVQISIPPLRDRGNDILLLARKFASDFAERYRMPEISFADSAKRELLAYKWPGNVRQLKNIVEQTAIFEAGNEITADILAKYLPEQHHFSTQAPHSTSPAIRTTAYDREREMLLNMIFSMKKEISELREMIKRTQPQKPEHISTALTITAPISPVTHNNEISHTAPPQIIDVDAIDQPVTATASTLAENERTMIRQALERNDGRRKETAKELNISERTLYRKIKEYGLE